MHGPNHPSRLAEDGEHLRMTAAFVAYFPFFHSRAVPAKPTGRANARPMTGSARALDPSIQISVWSDAGALTPSAANFGGLVRAARQAGLWRNQIGQVSF